MDKKFDVTIVGLGPVGSLLALLLNKAGLSVLGIDKDREIFQLPRAVTINDEGLRIMQRLDMEDISREEARAEIAASIAANRFGNPEEFGATCAFLCSTHAGFISGQNIQLDGRSYDGLI